MLIVVLLTVLTRTALGQECQKKDYGNGGHVCVCNSAYCDTIPRPTFLEPPSYFIYTSNKAGLRFNQSGGAFIETNEIFDKPIYINSTTKYQEILGWGGAFTDATGINIKSLPQNTQDKLLESYFSNEGIEYSLCRVPIGGTDFSQRKYSYDDDGPDPDLTKFNLAPEDFQYKIPYIKKALNLSQGNLQLFSSIWIAPTWMKTSGIFTGGSIKPSMYQTHANYFIKFFNKYEEQGIKFWGVTTSNEPSLNLIPFNKIPTIGWNSDQMATWIQNYLGPTIRNSSYADLKIMMLDDQRLYLPWFVEKVLKDQTTRDYVDGIAVHWYLDFLFPASLLSETHKKFPEKFLLGTEACHGDKPFQKHVDLGSWDRGESYAADIIEDVLNWVSGWVDWNMALNLQGGPTYISNNVDSSIIVNATAGEFYKQPMFYTIGHFSKFVPRGSVRIDSSCVSNSVSCVAFRRPDNGTAVIILNKENKVVPVALVDDRRGSTKINLTERSITTVLYW